MVAIMTAKLFHPWSLDAGSPDFDMILRFADVTKVWSERDEDGWWREMASVTGTGTVPLKLSEDEGSTNDFRRAFVEAWSAALGGDEDFPIWHCG